MAVSDLRVMGSLNAIPDHLRGPDRDDRWTPGRGLAVGAAWTGSVALLLGIPGYLLERFLPLVSSHGLIGIATGFLVTCILFAVMHRSSGMVGGTCTAIVIGWMIVVSIVIDVLIALHMPVELMGTVSFLTMTHRVGLLLGNWPIWAGMAGASVLCHNGNGTIHDVLDLMMVNPLSGRRM